MSPTQRSLKKLRDDGWTPYVVEYWHHFAKQRRDLFGILDIVAFRPPYTLGLQTTTGSNASTRVHKIQESEAYPLLLACGWRVQV